LLGARLLVIEPAASARVGGFRDRALRGVSTAADPMPHDRARSSTHVRRERLPALRTPPSAGYRVFFVPPRQIPRRLGALAAVTALGLAGCASSSTQTAATAFIHEHGGAAARAAAATKALELDVSRLSSAPTRSQLQRLARAAAEGRRDVVQAGEWNVTEGGEEGAEEEDLPRAEHETTEGASELANATSAAQAYARTPTAAALARYQRELARGREQWNEGISQLWYLGHRANPPTV
jgi:hypothetical protein